MIQLGQIRSVNILSDIFLPDRNLTHHPRAELARNICELIHPLPKPQHICISSQNNAGGMGKSETILDALIVHLRVVSLGLCFGFAVVQRHR
jgi:hypothetical protein